jgi:hypothetical protein
MTLYKFLQWQDETGAVIGTTPTLTYMVTSNKTFRAVYEIVRRTVTYESTPITVAATIDATIVPSGASIEVNDGTLVTISVPSEVEV